MKPLFSTPPAPPSAPLFAAQPPLTGIQQLAALMAPPAQQAQPGGMSGISGLNLGALAQMMNGSDGGKPDPTFGYGVGNLFSRLGMGSNLPTSQATGALGSNSAGGMGFGASY